MTDTLEDFVEAVALFASLLDIVLGFCTIDLVFNDQDYSVLGQLI